MWMVLVWQIVTICQMAKLPPAKLFRYMVAHTESGAGCSWDFNYPALVSLINGQYYMEYHAIFHMMGIPVMLKAIWNKAIGWLGNNVKEIAKMT